MNTLKSIGGTLLGIAIFIGVIIATVLFFAVGSKVAFTIAPFINWLAGILFAINLLLLLFAVIPKARGIVGLIMVGAMTSQTVVFKTILEFKMKGQSLMNVQSALDSIFKGIVPLLMTFGCYKLLNKKVNVIAIIFGIVALGIVLSLLGIC